MSDLSLHAIGIAEATDKGSIGHNYLQQYERVLGSLRLQRFNMIEIGVLNGASLRMWEKYFPYATIVGIDIRAECQELATDRIRIEIGSQADREFLSRVCAKYQPLVIIDDGSHMADHVLVSLETLFPLLSPGGWYIIEDMDAHTGEGADRYKGTATITPPELMLWLASVRMAGWISPEEDSGLRQYLFHHVDGLEIINHAAILRKRILPSSELP